MPQRGIHIPLGTQLVAVEKSTTPNMEIYGTFKSFTSCSTLIQKYSVNLKNLSTNYKQATKRQINDQLQPLHSIRLEKAETDDQSFCTSQCGSVLMMTTT